MAALTRLCTALLALGAVGASAPPLTAQSSAAPEVLLRLDDVGMNHSVNTAIARVAETGMPFSVSVMFACPSAVVEGVAKKYGVGISRWFGESYHSMFETSIEAKKAEFLALLASADAARVNLVVVHVAERTPEMEVLFDRNNAAQNSGDGLPLVARHRQSELEMILSPEFAGVVRSGKVRLITYRELIARAGGLSAMRRPR